MIMYKQLKLSDGTVATNAIIRTTDNAFIPFDPANTDYQQMKKDLANGAELQDASGNIMTATQIQTFLQGLK